MAGTIDQCDCRTCDSRTEQIQIVMPGDTNGYGRLFGGRLMEWIDIVAAVVGRRHSGREVITASIDHLHFSAPAYLNNTVVLIGRVTYAGHTSVEVCVDTYAEDISGERRMINQAYVLMVALDENEKPTPVPGIELVSDEQRAEWARGKERCELRKRKRLGGTCN